MTAHGHSLKARGYTWQQVLVTVVGFHIIPGDRKASLASQISDRFCTRLGYFLSFKTQTCSEFHLFSPSDNT